MVPELVAIYFQLITLVGEASITLKVTPVAEFCTPVSLDARAPVESDVLRTMIYVPVINLDRGNIVCVKSKQGLRTARHS